MRDKLIRFEDVEALATDGGQLLCRVGGRDVWIPSDRIAIDDYVVQRPGDRGRLVIGRELALNLGLV